MTREAKIGMLTGLGVIVAIGVLLSEYLGDRNTGPSAVPVATGRMATLPTGESYRQQQLTPVGVPAMTPAGGGDRTPLAGGGVISSPIATGSSQLPPTMFAADSTMAGGATGPSMSGPVTPIAAGPTLMDGQSSAGGGGPPVITLEPLVPVLKPVDSGKAAAGAGGVGGVTYTIQSGDTLAKIAKRFYNSSKNSDVARIVAANPGVIKDTSAMLVVNKKIVIPNVPAAPAVSAVVAAVAPKPMDPGVVSVPGGTADGIVPIPGVVQPPKKDGLAAGGGAVVAPKPDVPKGDTAKTTTYVVQSGDTLEKIARRIAPSKVSETVVKLTILNALKDASRLKVGQTLKVPA